MNILFLLHSYPKIGGIETVTHTMAQYLGKRHRVFFLSRITDSSVDWEDGEYFLFPNKIQRENVVFFNELVDRLSIDIVIHQGPFLPFNRIVFNPQRNSTVRVFSFLHFVPGFDFQRIHDLWRTEPRWSKRWLKRIKARMGFYGAQYNPDKIRRKYRLLYDQSVRTITLAKGDNELFVKNYRLTDDRKLLSISNPSRFQKQEADLLERKENIVLYVGRLDADAKRVDRLLRIWKLIDLDGWRLKIVGDGPHRQELEEMVSDQYIANVEFVGKVNDPEPYYREAKIGVLTSTFEGFPMCIIEGMQFGVVPIAFDVSPGVRELIVDNGIGSVVTAFDQAEYADRLKQLMTNRELYNAFSEKALSIAGNYSVESIGRLWDDLLMLNE